MKQIFVDTSDFAAVFNKRDHLHEKALRVEKELGIIEKVTTELVLIEVLNYFCEFRLDIKGYVTKSINYFIVNKEIEIIPCSSGQFAEGFYFYKSRLDKGYSLTDCISMNVMRERNISEILTNDNHFRQEGFRILL
ncbi:MAG: type II toxin-antitoxin system VapC family toxin [Pyrinomonadaceae bacterium]